MTPPSGPLAMLGSGGRPYREYALEAAVRAAAARGRPVVLLLADAPGWQREHLPECRTTDLQDPAAVLASLRALPQPVDGVLTWDETALQTCAAVAEHLGLPHASVAAVHACRDKLVTRTALAAAGVPSPRFRHVGSVAEAVAAAEELSGAGSRAVVVKPRSLAGSLGVTLAATPAEVAAAYREADAARVAGLTARPGVLVEEFATGPEISVDAAVSGGRVVPAVVARKKVGFPPFFEELGHLVQPWQDEPWADAVREVLVAAHRTLRIDAGITHTELRLTPTGPKIIEVNGRLGGDLIPLLGRLAGGVDLIDAAVAVALGEEPRLPAPRSGCAAVEFLYPPADVRVTDVSVDDADPPAWLERIAVLAAPGTDLRLPPRGLIPRYAAVVVTGPNPQSCRDRLYQARRRVGLSYESLDAPRRRSPGPPERRPP